MGKSFNRFVDDATHDMLISLGKKEGLAEAMRDVTTRHAERLTALGPVQVLALDPCPRCGGRVIAGDIDARCVAGCGWSYRRLTGPEPVASRRADP